MKLFKTSGMNWQKGNICSAHWSRNTKDNTDHLPDIIVPPDQLEKLKVEL